MVEPSADIDPAPSRVLQKCSFCGKKSVWPPDEGLIHAHRGCYLDYCQGLADNHLLQEGDRIPYEDWSGSED